MTEQVIGEVGDAAHGTLVASEVATVRLTSVAGVSVLVHPGGTQPVWVSVDGSIPEVSGARSRPVWPGNSATFATDFATAVDVAKSGVLRGLDGAISSSGSGDQDGEVVVRLVCTAAAAYTVEAG